MAYKWSVCRVCGGSYSWTGVDKGHPGCPGPKRDAPAPKPKPGPTGKKR